VKSQEGDKRAQGVEKGWGYRIPNQGEGGNILEEGDTTN